MCEQADRREAGTHMGVGKGRQTDRVRGAAVLKTETANQWFVGL